LAYTRNERTGENSEMEQRDLGWLEVKDGSLGKPGVEQEGDYQPQESWCLGR
jgi:hypothetical protein